MAGGPSTPELVAAVSAAGGLGMLAAGYRTAEDVAAEIEAVRKRLPGGEAFGLNLFAPVAGPADRRMVSAYAKKLGAQEAAAGVPLGEAKFDDDDFQRKLQVVRVLRPAVVSFAFGRPEPALVSELQRHEIAVWVTVTTPAEGTLALEAGADALIAQGAEAGGHRGGFDDTDEPPLSLDDLLRGLAPLGASVIAAGGIIDAADTARATELGASGVQAGTAFLRTPEAGTSDVHRKAVASSADTVLTRAFSGRRARGIVNGWTASVGARAPRAYPEVHHLTAPLRAAGRAAGDHDLVNLWAGTGHARAQAVPAADVVGELQRGLA